jgi:type II secretory pathway pseudopilin PulG
MRSYRRSRRAGFTLIELLVSLVVMVEVILAVLLLFDFNNKLARVQTNVADMQQSIRVVQYETARAIRMAGRGGLLSFGRFDAGPPKSYQGLAVGVIDNAGNSLGIRGGVPGATNPQIEPGTDVLRIRGVFSTPIYQLNTADTATFAVVDSPPANTIPNTGTLIVKSKSPTGVTQDLKPFEDALAAGRKEVLIITSPLGDQDFGIVEFDPATTTIDTDDGGLPTPKATQMTIHFKIEDAPDWALYAQLMPGNTWPAALGSGNTEQGAAAYVGILEEYRYYVRRDYVDPSDPTSELSPKFSRARVYPGTDRPYIDDSNLRADIADNIWDFQVALGFDFDTGTAKGGSTENLGSPAGDEWLFNGADDDPSGPPWPNTTSPAPAADTALNFVRITTLALTDRRDFKYQAPTLADIEDRAYAASLLNTSSADRMFRRRLQTTVIDLRNL